jgi:hypothetical protein
MRGVRKESPTHRRVRPRLLRSARAAIAAGIAAVVVAACSGRAPAAVPPPGEWLQLQSSAFVRIARPEDAVTVAQRPWTVQSRVADMAFLGDTLYGAVNGSGLAAITLDAAGQASFVYHADPLIFGHRTITTLVPRQDSLAIHLYYNALLNDVPQKDLTIAGISLVSWLPGRESFTFLIPPFQRKNPDWEAAGFVPESENSFDFEWKFTDATETRFAYTRFHADTRAEETADRAAYMAALGVPSISGPAVPSNLAGFFAACRDAVPSLQPGTALQFSLRSRESPVRRGYRSKPESDSALVIPVFEEEGTLYALLPEGRILAAAPAGSARSVSLPPLPRGYHYTDIVKTGGYMVIPWEETSFTDVGRAGILVHPIPR